MSSVKIYIHLPEESAYKPTQAIALGDNKFKVLPTPDYDPEDEEWAFLPGTIVRCEIHDYDGMKYLRAVEAITE